MAAERRRWCGEMLGLHMAWVAGVWSGKMPDAERLNPYRGRGKADPPKTPEQVEHESGAGWAAFDCFMGKKSKRKA
jgi:hypothetical protein